MVSSRRAKPCKSVAPQVKAPKRQRPNPGKELSPRGSARKHVKVFPPKPCTSVAPQVRATKQAQRTKSRPKPCTSVAQTVYKRCGTVYKCCAIKAQKAVATRHLAPVPSYRQELQAITIYYFTQKERLVRQTYLLVEAPQNLFFIAWSEKQADEKRAEVFNIPIFATKTARQLKCISVYI